MKRIVLYLVLFFSVSAVDAQNKSLDSLRVLLKTSKYDTTKIRLKVEIGEALPIDRLDYWDTLYQESKKLNIKWLEAHILLYTGILLYYQNEIPRALTYYERSLKLQEIVKNKLETAILLNNMGLLYDNLGYIPKALNYYIKSLKLNEEIGDKIESANLLNSIGSVYLSQGQKAQALDYYFRGLKLLDGVVGSERVSSYLLVSISNFYYKQNDNDKALYYGNRSLKLAEQLGDKRVINNSVRNLGAIFKEDDLQKALNYFFKSLTISKDMGSKEETARSFLLIGHLFFTQKKYSYAHAYTDSSLTLSKELEFPIFIKNAEFVISKIDSASGNYSASLEHYKQYIVYRDSVNNNQTQKAAIKSQLDYEFDKKESLLKAEQEKKDALQQKELQQKNYLILGSSAIALLIALLAFLFIRKNKLQSLNKTLLLEQKLLRTQMNPHFIFNLLNSIQNFIYKGKKDEAYNYIGKFAKLMRAILENSRSEFVSMEKEIKILENYLILNQLLLDNKFDYRIDIDEEIDIESINIPTMMAQPFIENALKHGIQTKEGKGFIHINFKKIDTSNMLFEVEDNGIGLSEALLASKNNSNHTSFATNITRERLDNFYPHKQVDVSVIEIRDELNAIVGTKTFFTIPFSYN